MDFGWTQDYQEYDFQEQLHKQEYNMFTRQTRAKLDLTIADRINFLPIEIRQLILKYLKEILTFGQPQLPQLLQIEFFVWHREELNFWARAPYSHNSAYPICRGYCLNCGEPAQQLRCLDPIKRWDKHWKYKLPLNTLALMGICYFCLCMGYNYSRPAFSEQTHNVSPPNYTRWRDRSKHYPNIY